MPSKSMKRYTACIKGDKRSNKRPIFSKEVKKTPETSKDQE